MADLSLAIKVRAEADAAQAEMKALAADVRNLGAQAQAATAPAAELAAVNGRLTSSFAASRGAIQNTAFQLQDFFVQVQAGTAANVALAQQLPQLLGGFGAMGAIIGAMVAILPGLISGLFSAGDAVAEFDAALDAADESGKNLKATLDLLAATPDKLTEKYAGRTAAIRDMLAAQAELDRAEQARTLAGVLSAARDQEITASVLSRDPVQVGGLAEGLIQIQNAFGLAEDAAQRFQDALATALSGESIPDGIRGFEEMRAILDAAGIRLADLPPEVQAWLAEVGKVEAAYREAVKQTEAADAAVAKAAVTTETATDAAGRLANQFGNAATAADAISPALQRALDIANQFKNAIPTPEAFTVLPGMDQLGRDANTALIAAGINPGGRADPSNSGRVKPATSGKSEAQREQEKADLEAKRAAEEAARDRARAIDDIARSYDRLLPSYERDVAAAGKWRDETLAALAATGEGTEAYAADVQRVYEGMLAKAYSDDLDRRTDWQAGVLRGLRDVQAATADLASGTENLVKDFSDGFGEAFSGLISGSKSAGEAFDDFADQIIADLLRIGAQQATSSLATSLIGSLFGGMLGGGGASGGFTVPFVGPQADGGVFPNISGWSNEIVSRPTFFAFAKGAGLMGEAGEEAVMPLRRDASGRLGVDASGLGGGGNVQVNVHNHAPGTRATTQERNEGGTRIVDVMVEQVEQAIAGNLVRGRGALAPALVDTFGLRRNARNP